MQRCLERNVRAERLHTPAQAAVHTPPLTHQPSQQNETSFLYTRIDLPVSPCVMQFRSELYVGYISHICSAYQEDIWALLQLSLPDGPIYKDALFDSLLDGRPEEKPFNRWLHSPAHLADVH